MFRLLPMLLVAVSTSLSATEKLPEDRKSWRAESVEKFADKVSGKIRKSSAISEAVPADNTLTPQQKQKAKSLTRENRNLAEKDHLIWVYDAWLTLRNDRDHDHYYQSFEITFDVDTSLNHADVYARLYLGDGEIFREFHTTSVFTIDALDVDDEFTVETDLLEGFHPQDYDILIEIYDAFDNQLEDSYDHTDDSDLYLVPLESREFDSHGGSSSGGQLVISHEHGGTAGWFIMSLLLITLIARNWHNCQATTNNLSCA